MSKFKEGDIVECLRDRPFAAEINKGQLAKITGASKVGPSISFINWPQSGFEIPLSWSGSDMDFELYVEIKANE